MTAVRLLETQLVNTVGGTGATKFSADHGRLFCFGHIPNIIARAILHGNGVKIDVGAMSRGTAEEEGVEIQQEQARIKEWKKSGPLGEGI